MMAALPYLFAGLQIAAPAAFLGAMVGEFTGAERGMGVLTVRAIRALDVEMTWGIATVPTAVAILAYLAIGALARRVLLEAPPVILAAPSAGGSRRRSRADAALAAALALDRAALFARASLFALATRYEGYGLVFDEAIVHGLPIVSCHTGAVPETVPAESGQLVPPDDAKAFAAALADLLGDETRYQRCADAALSAAQRLP